MSHSLGEIETLAIRAARGAGMAWGLAEDAGRAVAWLCAHALPGAERLAALLLGQSDRDRTAAFPEPCADAWQARSGALCPIATGAALSDRAAEISKKTALRLLRCDEPVLLLPSLASVAQRTGVPIRCDTVTFSAVCSSKGLYVAQSPPDAPNVEPLDVTLTPGAPLQGVRVHSGNRATPSESALKTLTELSCRLYAPETQDRRRSGAGEDT